MHGPWFHLEAIPPAGETVALSRKEAKHALGSKRMRGGEVIVLFDGRGTLGQGVLGDERELDGSVAIAIEQRIEVAADTCDVELAASLPKGDRLSTMLDMSTQAGMNSFRPLECEFSVVKESAMRVDRRERWERIMLEACKQSERAFVPTLAAAASPLAIATNAIKLGRTVLVAERGGEPVHTCAARCTGGVTILVGPEGGFSATETHSLREAGACAVSLGASIYRIETAAVVAVAAIKNACV